MGAGRIACRQVSIVISKKRASHDGLAPVQGRLFVTPAGGAATGSSAREVLLPASAAQPLPDCAAGAVIALRRRAKLVE